MITEEQILDNVAKAGKITKEDAEKLLELAKTLTFQKFLASVLAESEAIALRLSKADLTVEQGVKNALREQGIAQGMENVVNHLLGIFNEHNLTSSEGDNNGRSSSDSSTDSTSAE